MNEIRLQKFMADCGVASRRKCEEYILKGLVRVNGEIVNKLGIKVVPDKDIVEYNGKKIQNVNNKKVYILLNKPIGYVTTVKEQFGRPTVMELVKNERRIELANEGLRFFDMIRWKDAEKVPAQTGVGLSGETYGAYMRLDGVGANDRTVLIDGVPRRYVETRFFDASKHYLLPIPQGQIDRNPNLGPQNPGW